MPLTASGTAEGSEPGDSCAFVERVGARRAMSKAKRGFMAASWVSIAAIGGDCLAR
jgi:hypothetical protein